MFKLILFTFFLQGCVGYTSLTETPTDQTDLGSLLAQRLPDASQTNEVGDAALNEYAASPEWTENLKNEVKGDTGSKWQQTSEGTQNPQGGKFRAGHGGQSGVGQGGKFGAGQGGKFGVGQGGKFGAGQGGKFGASRGGKFGASRGGKFGAGQPSLETGNVDLIETPNETIPPSSPTFLPEEPVVQEMVRGGTSIYGEDIHDNPVVDILVIKDVSRSMRAMATKSSNGVMYNLNSLDWRIGFLSADANYVGFMQLMLNREPVIGHHYIDKSVQQHEQTFAETLTLSRRSIPCTYNRQCGKHKERPLGALHNFLEKGSSQYPFLRQGADLAVIIITDNDENRHGVNRDMTTTSDIMEVMEKKYPDKKIKAYSMTVMEESCRQDMKKRYHGSEGYSASVIIDFVKRTKGRSFDLCNSSYAEVAAAIAEHQIGVLPLAVN